MARPTTLTPVRRSIWREGATGTRRELLQRRARLLLALVVLALPVAVYLAFVHSYGVNVPFKDEWNAVNLYQLLQHGHLSLSAIWAQENESRLLFAYPVMLVIYALSHADTKVEMYVSAVLLLAAALTALNLFRRTSQSPLLWAAPAFLFLFSLAQYAITLQGFAVAIYMVVFFSMAALAGLLGSERRSWIFALAIAAAIVASYSEIEGLAIWPAGLVFLAATGQHPRRILVWLASGALISGIYWIGYQWSSTGGGTHWLVTHPLAAVRYLLVLMGSSLPHSRQLHLNSASLTAVGGAVLLLGLSLFLVWLRHRRLGRLLSVPLALLTVGFVIDVLITIGRGHLGLATASSSRYTVYNLWLLAGLWLGAVAIYRALPSMAAKAQLGLTAALGLVQVILSYHAGLAAGSSLHAQHLIAADQLRHYRTASAGQVVRYVTPDYSVFRRLAPFLARHHLSVFSR